MELAGYTSRVGNMLDVFEEVGRGQYQKPSINGDGQDGQRQWGAHRLTVQNGIPIATGKLKGRLAPRGSGWIGLA